MAKQRKAHWIICVVIALLAAACGGRAPTAPASQPQPPKSREAVLYQLSGVVTDDDGNPIPSAALTVDFVPTDKPYDHRSVIADAVGRYSIEFYGVPGGIKTSVLRGPVGTDDAVALVSVGPPGCGLVENVVEPECAFDPDFRYVVSKATRIAQDFHLHRLTRIAAAASTIMTIAPDDRLCALGFTAQFYVCRNIHVLASAAGMLTIEAASADGTSTLVVVGWEDAGLPFSFSTAVSAGQDLVVHLAVPLGLSSNRSVLVNTSIAPR